MFSLFTRKPAKPTHKFVVHYETQSHYTVGRIWQSHKADFETFDAALSFCAYMNDSTAHIAHYAAVKVSGIAMTCRYSGRVIGMMNLEA